MLIWTFWDPEPWTLDPGPYHYTRKRTCPTMSNHVQPCPTYRLRCARTPKHLALTEFCQSQKALFSTQCTEFSTRDLWGEIPLSDFCGARLPFLRWTSDLSHACADGVLTHAAPAVQGYLAKDAGPAKIQTKLSFGKTLSVVRSGDRLRSARSVWRPQGPPRGLTHIEGRYTSKVGTQQYCEGPRHGTQRCVLI